MEGPWSPWWLPCVRGIVMSADYSCAPMLKFAKCFIAVTNRSLCFSSWNHEARFANSHWSNKSLTPWMLSSWCCIFSLEVMLPQFLSHVSTVRQNHAQRHRPTPHSQQLSMPHDGIDGDANWGASNQGEVPPSASLLMWALIIHLRIVSSGSGMCGFQRESSTGWPPHRRGMIWLGGWIRQWQK